MNAMNGLIFNTDNYRFIMFSEYNKVYIIICDINYFRSQVNVLRLTLLGVVSLLLLGWIND
jgi:hypothetical protein